MARPSRFCARRNRRRSSGVQAYTLIDIFVFLVSVGVLGSIVLPAYFGRTKCRCQRINCNNNLKQTGLSYKQWALDMQDRFPMQVPVTNGGTMEFVNSGVAWVHFRVMSNELNTPKVLFCPNEKATDRIAATTFGSLAGPGQVPYTNDNNVTYFVGVDASETNYNMWLSGDHNITNRLNPKHGLLSFPTNRPTGWTADLHNSQGNIALTDGSVHQYNTARLQLGLLETGVQRIRLAMP
jgi:hypothetical protein